MTGTLFLVSMVFFVCFLMYAKTVQQEQYDYAMTHNRFHAGDIVEHDPSGEKFMFIGYSMMGLGTCSRLRAANDDETQWVDLEIVTLTKVEQ